jgi:hypothetical protein
MDMSEREEAGPGRVQYAGGGDEATAVTHEVQAHFRLHVYAVVARLLANLEAMGASQGDFFATFPFLSGYRAALSDSGMPACGPAAQVAWWDRQISNAERRERGHLPLAALRRDAGLGAAEVRLVVAAGLVEEDIRFGALFAALQEPLASRRPCIGLLNWLLGEPDAAAGDSWPACRELLDRGLLLADNRSDPRAEWVLRVPPPVWDAVRGRPVDRPLPGLERQAAETFPLLDDLILPDELLGQVMRLPGLLAGGQAAALVLRGMQGTGRRAILGATARSLGMDVLLWQGTPGPAANGTGAQGGLPADDAWKLLGPLATLTRAMPVLRIDPGPGETVELPALACYRGPVGITLGRAGGIRGPLVERGLSLNVPPPDREARRRFWVTAGAAVAPGSLDEIADRFLLTGGHIRRTAALAATYAALAQRRSLIADDVQQAARSLNREALETLATHLPAAEGWREVVVGAATGRELDALAARCRRREQLRDEAGPAFGDSLNRGVRALFSGPSGTGKTLAARALAGELQMDLYRVDLAAVVNKYIGETERNLNQVLSRAEELDVLLLLDEGDALMTRRTEVRNANDRYANLETNYLLQRLETFEGIAIITTNAGQRIDGAFLRRLDVIVEFTPPDAQERWLIWDSHLPADHRVDPGLLDEIAFRCVLTGGQIRNAALHATLLAGAGHALRDEHLEAALQREYRKAGAAYPVARGNGHEGGGQLARLRRVSGELG